MPENTAVRYRATLAYDGTAYQGFQRQVAGIPTVQGMVEQAINQVTQQSVTLIGAGRTDSGVHATGQVIVFDVIWKHQDRDLLRAINACLPNDIALQDMRQHMGFHPRYDAQARTYRYQIIQAEHPQPLLRNVTWRVYKPLELGLMREAATLLIGEHDFASFGQPPQGNNTVREVFRSEWTTETNQFGELLIYEIEATAYLYHMVRRIVGTLVAIGRGDLTLTEFKALFASCDVSQVKVMAPPQGLTLVRVDYKNE